VVGVAQPVGVTFSKPVTDRAAAVPTVHITSSRYVTEHFDGSNDATTPSR
jgi:Bacterial Ig domain